jgi:hypothetical protein
MFNNLSDRSKIILQLLFFSVLCLIAYGILNNVISSRPNNGSSQLRFEVEASGGFALITLRSGDVTMIDADTVTVPWSKTIKIKSGTTVYLTASNPTATGQITCNITLDGVAWKTESINSPKDGVACAGIIP